MVRQDDYGLEEREHRDADIWKEQLKRSRRRTGSKKNLSPHRDLCSSGEEVRKGKGREKKRREEN